MLKFFFFMLQQLELLLVMFCQVLPILHCTSRGSSPISTFHFSPSFSFTSRWPFFATLECPSLSPERHRRCLVVCRSFQMIRRWHPSYSMRLSSFLWLLTSLLLHLQHGNDTALKAKEFLIQWLIRKFNMSLFRRRYRWSLCLTLWAWTGTFVPLFFNTTQGMHEIRRCHSYQLHLSHLFNSSLRLLHSITGSRLSAEEVL